MENQVLGFVGVGRMGGPMASRLLDAGYSLCVFDTNPEAVKPLVARGAKVAASPAEVGSAARIVLMSLPTPPIVQAVALGADGITRGSSVKVAHRSLDVRTRHVDDRRARRERTRHHLGRFARERRREGRRRRARSP